MEKMMAVSTELLENQKRNGPAPKEKYWGVFQELNIRMEGIENGIKIKSQMQYL